MKRCWFLLVLWVACALPSPAAADVYCLGEMMGVTGIVPGPRQVWYATHYAGLGHFERETGKFVPFAPDWAREALHTPGYIGLWSIALLDGKIWTGTFCALDRFDPASGGVTRLTPAQGLPSPQVLCLTAARGQLWAGCEEGLACLDADGKLLRAWRRADGLPGSTVFSLAVAGDTLWVGASGGIAALEPDGVARPFGKTEGPVLALDVTERFVAAGTDAGVFILDRQSGDTVRRLRAADGLPLDRVNCLAFHDEALWIGTRLGLCRWDLATGALRRFTLAEGLPGDAVLCAVRDGDHLWLGTTVDKSRKLPFLFTALKTDAPPP